MVALRDEPPTLYSTGMRDVDRVLRGGLAPGELCIVAALTTHGKTMFMANLSYQFAFEGIKSLFLSEEMTVEQLADRANAYASSLPPEEWQSQWERAFDDVIAFYDVRANMLVSKPVIEADAAVDAIAQAVEHYGVKVVFVDYLQKLRGKGEDETSKLKYVSAALSTAAATHNVLIVAGAQFNRESNKEKVFIPRVSYIKGSSYIEQDAATILMLVWPWLLDSTKPKSDYHVYCGKNRNRGIGERGFAEVYFEPHRQKIRDKDMQEKYSDTYINDFDRFNASGEF